MPFPYYRFQRSSCLVRIQLCPDRQRVFIRPDTSVIRMMKSNSFVGSLVRKLCSNCRCISEFLANPNPTVEIGSISCFCFLVNQNPKLYSDRFRCLVNQNPKPSDVDEFLAQDEFSDSSFSIQKRRGFCSLFLFAQQASYRVRRESIRFAVLDLLTTDRIFSFTWSDSDYNVIFATVSETPVVVFRI